MVRSAVTRLVCFTSLATLAVTGCSISADPALVLTGALVPFDACDDVLSYLKDAAVERVGPYGLDGAMTRGYGSGPVNEDSVAPAVGGPAGADPSYSTTNVQESGVDEPDIVKTDGVHLVSVVDGTLRVFDAVTGAAVGSLELGRDSDEPTPKDPDQPSFDVPSGQVTTELLLAGKRALVLIQHSSYGIADQRLPVHGGYPSASTELVLVDLSTAAQPHEIARTDVDADLVSARLVDGVARVAVSAQPSIDFPWDDPLADDEAALLERNTAIIEQSQLSDWLPSLQWTSGADTDQQLLTPCDRLSYPPTFSGFSIVSVLSLPIDSDLREVNATGVLGGGDIVYSSPERFYVVSNDWSSLVPGGVAPVLPAPEIGDAETTNPKMDPGPPASQNLSLAAPSHLMVRPQQLDARTNIHAFDISEPGPARYVGSGAVAGRLIGQYALSEWGGNLRVASTILPVGGPAARSHSRVTVLAEQDGDLIEIGIVDGLGVGEEIYAVRYVGPTAYVVTFRQTDPLYVVDLSDPTEPVVRGQLKLKGYSAYLHSIGDGRMVGVGQGADRLGVQRGAQISLFDVSDPVAPTRLASDVVPGGWTEAEWDARAFLYWDDTGDVVVPMSSASRTGALVLSVTNDTVQERGWVTSAGSHDTRPGAAVRRSLVVGDRLFTVWDDGVQSNDLLTLDDLSWTPFAA